MLWLFLPFSIHLLADLSKCYIIQAYRQVEWDRSAFATEQARLHDALRYGWDSASSSIAGQYPPVVAHGPPPAVGYPNYLTQAPYLGYPQAAFGADSSLYTQSPLYQMPITTQPLMVGGAFSTIPQSTSNSQMSPSEKRWHERRNRYQAEKEKSSGADVKTESNDMQPQESLEEWRATKNQPASRLERRRARVERMEALITQFWEEADNERRELHAELAQLVEQTGRIASGKAKSAKEATTKQAPNGKKDDAAAPGPDARSE
ncbi:MAG: hypothetical protein Q9181_003073 [Wetmoreana brouardii]